MADFLASFNFGQNASTSAHESACHSIDDIQTQLRNTFEAKVTPTRAEHISLSLELPASSNITLPESDNDNLDGPLAGAQPEPMRLVSVNDALVRQTDDPLLQRTIAKHILRAMGGVDNSNWIVRDMSRASQGWSFTYICKSSHQFWRRQNAKTPPASLIGEFSLREPDPVLMGRPAFDCRGSVLIAFERSSRSIAIRYEHTPMHQTVAQLKDLYPAPVRELGAGAQRQLQQKTPTKSKKSRNSKNQNDANGEQTDAQKQPKKKRKADTNGDGEIGGRAKKQRKRKKGDGVNAAPQQLQQELAHDPSQESSQVQTGGEAVANAGLPDQSSNQTQPSSNLHPVNVDATEAARRLAYATKLLEDAGIAPSTLSSQQMHIFSNQLPELQRDSLALLSKYGAQHIVIVPPKDKSGAAPRSQSSTPIQAQQAPPPVPATTARAATVTTTATNTTTQAAPDSSEQALLEAAASALSTVAQSSQKKGKRPPGKSRLACSCCKNRKVKCPKERPVCSECQATGQKCEYPPVKPRKKKAVVSEPVVIDDENGDEEEEDEEEEEEQEEETFDTTQHRASESQAAHPEQQDTTYSQMPVADMLRPIAQQNAAESYQSHSAYYQPAPITAGSQSEPSQAPYPNSTVPQSVATHSSWARPEMQTNYHGSHVSNVSNVSNVSTNSTQAGQMPKPTRSISPNQSRRNAKELTSQGRWKLPDSKPKPSAVGWGNSSVTHSTTQPNSHTHPHSHSGHSAENWMGNHEAQSFNMTANERTPQSTGLYSHQVPATSSHVQNSTFQTSNDNTFWPQHSQASVVHQSQPTRQSPRAAAAAMHVHSRTSPFQGINQHQRTTTGQTHRSQTWAENNQGRDPSLSSVPRPSDVYNQNYYGTMDMSRTNRYQQ